MKTIVSWTKLILLGYGIYISFIVLWIYLTQDPPYHFPLGDVAILFVGILVSIFIGTLMIKSDESTIYSPAPAHAHLHTSRAY